MPRKSSKTAPSSSPAPQSGKQKSKSVTFEFYAPEARNVVVAGSFNNWKTTETKLKKDKSGRWTLSLDLTPGNYEYRYVVDGNWTNDQNGARTIQNPYGSINNIVEVR